MNRQRLLLALLGVALAASLLYAFWAMPRQEKAPPKGVPKPVAGAARSGKAAPVAKVDRKGEPPADRLLLDLLDREPHAFPGAGRDIFRFAGRGPAVVVEVEPVEVVPPPPPPPKPPPTPEEILREAVTEITFLGFLEKRGTRTVFLTSGDDVYLVKTGERFGKNKELIVRQITARQLVVGWIDGPEKITVQLLENEKLQPATISAGKGGKEKASAPASASSGGFPGTGTPPPRRLLVPQRSAEFPQPQSEPFAPEPPEEEINLPKDSVSLEELLKKGLPRGE